MVSLESSRLPNWRLTDLKTFFGKQVFFFFPALKAAAAERRPTQADAMEKRRARFRKKMARFFIARRARALFYCDRSRAV
jgi:hypothetical protein